MNAEFSFSCKASAEMHLKTHNLAFIPFKDSNNSATTAANNNKQVKNWWSCVYERARNGGE